VKELQI
jgi:hypothetical protein